MTATSAAAAAGVLVAAGPEVVGGQAADVLAETVAMTEVAADPAAKHSPSTLIKLNRSPSQEPGERFRFPPG